MNQPIKTEYYTLDKGTFHQLRKQEVFAGDEFRDIQVSVHETHEEAERARVRAEQIAHEELAEAAAIDVLNEYDSSEKSTQDAAKLIDNMRRIFKTYARREE